MGLRQCNLENATFLWQPGDAYPPVDQATAVGTHADQIAPCVGPPLAVGHLQRGKFRAAASHAIDLSRPTRALGCCAPGLQELAEHVAANEVRSLSVAGGKTVLDPPTYRAPVHVATAGGFLGRVEPVDLDAQRVDVAPLAPPHDRIAGGSAVSWLRLAATRSAIQASTSDASQATDFSESRIEAGNLPSAISR